MRVFRSDVHPIVSIKDEGVYGIVVEWHGDLALVEYYLDHIKYQEYLEPDEYEIVAGILFEEVEE